MPFIGHARILIISSQSNSPTHLTLLNASLRRTYLTTKLLSPLYVSLLTTSLSYRTSTIILAAGSALSLGWELWWIGVVWKGWRCLEEDEERRRVGVGGRMMEGGYEMVGTDSERNGAQGNGSGVDNGAVGVERRNRGLLRRAVDGVLAEMEDLVEFARLPIFLSECHRLAPTRHSPLTKRPHRSRPQAQSPSPSST